MDFFDRVKTLSKSKRITIESVANTAGLSIDSYNSYRRLGNLPRADEAVKIAQTLGTTVEYLVTGKHPEPHVDKPALLIALEELEKQIRNI